jgi:hypothetical protein
MRDLILSHEPAIRLGFFFGIFGIFGIVALNTVLVRLLLPTTAVALAMPGEDAGWRDLLELDQLSGMFALPFLGKLPDHATNRWQRVWSKRSQATRSDTAMRTPLIINGPPCGTEHRFNGLRLATVVS